MVKYFIDRFIKEVEKRSNLHDRSKLLDPEKSLFDIYTPKLKSCTYGSDEYKKYLQELKIALDHHYGKNRHHPEHYKNGIKDMSLADIVEMLCDWKAAKLRHEDGDLLKSIEINQNRFNYTDELKLIMINEAKYMYKYRIEWDCCDGRGGIILGDKVEDLKEKISKIKELHSVEKKILINGQCQERVGKDFCNGSTVVDNAFAVDWIVQH